MSAHPLGNENFPWANRDFRFGLVLFFCLLGTVALVVFRVPTNTGKQKMSEVFPVRELKFLPENDGKVREFWASQEKHIKNKK